LRIARSAAEAVEGAEFVFLCVPTPQGSDGSADLSFVEAVSEEIKTSLRTGAIVVNKSTVPVGTAGLVERVTDRDDIKVVSNPEFLREGTAVADSLHPDRIVVGADDPAAAQRVGELFSATGAPLIVTTTTTAETIKYASNAFLATKLSFVNAIAALCEAVGADVRDLVLGLGYDKRIGFEFLRPGPGWGGSCLPKDTAALVHIAESAGYDFALLRGAMAQNDEQLDRVVKKITEAAGGSLESVAVAVWGLTFKADTDDRRCSPAAEITGRLVRAGAKVTAYDPTVATNEEGHDLIGVTLSADPYEACRGAAVVALLTEWDEFRWLDFEKVADLMDHASIVDARNLLDPRALRNKGFGYTGIGRP
jgi:UDPglucose 6-dehydrogenase